MEHRVRTLHISANFLSYVTFFILLETVIGVVTIFITSWVRSRK